MLPLKVSLSFIRCDCKEKGSASRGCCVLCEYCKFRIKAEFYSLHKTCHQILEEKEKK